MTVDQLIDQLAYKTSKNFLRKGTEGLRSATDFGHVFRRAEQGPCKLQGVYVLRPSADSSKSIVPVVYVCKAQSDEDADKIHRLVWNQDVVPFLLVCTPRSIRFYSGFNYRQSEKEGYLGILKVLTSLSEIPGALDGLDANAIDDGRIWRKWANDIKSEQRVDWMRRLRIIDGDPQLLES